MVVTHFRKKLSMREQESCCGMLDPKLLTDDPYKTTCYLCRRTKVFKDTKRMARPKTLIDVLVPEWAQSKHVEKTNETDTIGPRNQIRAQPTHEYYDYT